jgi:hypothetical protein
MVTESLDIENAAPPSSKSDYYNHHLCFQHQHQNPQHSNKLNDLRPSDTLLPSEHLGPMQTSVTSSSSSSTTNAAQRLEHQQSFQSSVPLSVVPLAAFHHVSHVENTGTTENCEKSSCYATGLKIDHNQHLQQTPATSCVSDSIKTPCMTDSTLSSHVPSSSLTTSSSSSSLWCLAAAAEAAAAELDGAVDYSLRAATTAFDESIVRDEMSRPSSGIVGIEEKAIASLTDGMKDDVVHARTSLSDVVYICENGVENLNSVGVDAKTPAQSKKVYSKVCFFGLNYKTTSN